MPSANVRISPESRETLRRLASEAGESMQGVLEKAIETYRRERFLRAANVEFAALKPNSKAWRELVEEQRRWDRTADDGLDPIWANIRPA